MNDFTKDELCYLQWLINQVGSDHMQNLIKPIKCKIKSMIESHRDHANIENTFHCGFFLLDHDMGHKDSVVSLCFQGIAQFVSRKIIEPGRYTFKVRVEKRDE